MSPHDILSTAPPHPAQASPGRVRSWAAREEWLPLPDFSNQLHSPPFAALLNCDSWRVGGWDRRRGEGGGGQGLIHAPCSHAAALPCCCSPPMLAHTINRSLPLPAVLLALALPPPPACLPACPPPLPTAADLAAGVPLATAHQQGGGGGGGGACRRRAARTGRAGLVGGGIPWRPWLVLRWHVHCLAGPPWSLAHSGAPPPLGRPIRFAWSASRQGPTKTAG